MTRFKLDRRTVIKGAGSIAIALPWLEIMGTGRKARAQTAAIAPKRFVTVYQPGGAVRQRNDRRQVHADRHRDRFHDVSGSDAASALPEPGADRRRDQPHLR